MRNVHTKPHKNQSIRKLLVLDVDKVVKRCCGVLWSATFSRTYNVGPEAVVAVYGACAVLPAVRVTSATGTGPSADRIDKMFSSIF
jgi:hypothetical protein